MGDEGKEVRLKAVKRRLRFPPNGRDKTADASSSLHLVCTPSLHGDSHSRSESKIDS